MSSLFSTNRNPTKQRRHRYDIMRWLAIKPRFNIVAAINLQFLRIFGWRNYTVVIASGNWLTVYTEVLPRWKIIVENVRNLVFIS